MTWEDRLRQAAYTSPSGTRVTFDFENVSKEVDKKTGVFEFPDADGAYIPDYGTGARRYPLRVFIWGPNYDLEAQAFEDALLERGIGRLEHPAYGVIDVVPFGTIKQRDDLKTAANQAVIEVTFWKTTGLLYPSSQQDPASAVSSAIDAYNVAVSQEFEDVTSLDSAVEQATFKNSYEAALNSARTGLQTVADTQDDVRKQFDNIYNSINTGIDVLVAQPLTLAFQTTLLIQSPARALTSIQARLDAYANLATSIISGDGAVVSPGYDSTNSNAFHTNDLYASTYVTGSVVSIVNNTFETKPAALAAAEFVLQQLDDVVAWRDANYESLAEIDTGTSYQKLQEAVALAAGFLVEISFTLKQERTLVLDRARTVIDLVAELYGSIDDELDFFINSNNLTGSEILELQRGREVVYYV